MAFEARQDAVVGALGVVPRKHFCQESGEEKLGAEDHPGEGHVEPTEVGQVFGRHAVGKRVELVPSNACLLYTSDAADD